MDDTILWITALVTGGGLLFTILISLCVMVPVLGGIVWGGWWLVKRLNTASTMNQMAATWPTTQGKVLQSRVEVHSRGEHTSVIPKIVYEYEVGGTKYQSDMVRAADKVVRWTNSQEAYAMVDRHPADSDVTVYYNPANPAQSALYR
jgi:hypothetical protein